VEVWNDNFHVEKILNGNLKAERRPKVYQTIQQGAFETMYTATPIALTTNIAKTKRIKLKGMVLD
jgi:hypothetical protein